MTADVIDASIVAKLPLQEPGSQLARELLAGADLIAPDLVMVEVANAMRKGVRDGRLDANDVEAGLQAVAAAISIQALSHHLVLRGLRLGLELNHHVQDCLYLALALDTGGRLLTTDDQFRTKAVAAGYHQVVRPF